MSWPDRLRFARLLGATAATRAAVGLRAAMGARHAPPPPEGPLAILMLASQPASHAGTRHRLAGWAERLRREGHRVELSLPVEGDEGERLYVNGDHASRARQHRLTLASRRRALARAPQFDVAIVHMSDLPYWEYGRPFIAEALARTAGRVILDLDDLPVARGEQLPGLRAEALVRAVDGLVVGNPEVASFLPARPAWFVPTCVDPDAWPVPDRSSRVGPTVLGWIGTSGGLAALEALAPVLAAACSRHGAKLRVICDAAPRMPGVPMEFVPWSGARETEDVAAIDVGLAPLADGPVARCKCGLKALQAMASGAPVVASAVGALSRIVVPGATGMLAKDGPEWAAALDALLADAALRRRLGAAGRAAVAARWSYAAHAAVFEKALRGREPNVTDSRAHG